MAHGRVRAATDRGCDGHHPRSAAAPARRTDRTDLDAAYDAEHLYVCPSCALPSGHDDEATGRTPLVARCRCCGGPLVPLMDAPDLPPPLDDSLARIASRRQLLWSRR